VTASLACDFSEGFAISSNEDNLWRWQGKQIKIASESG
jgi:hypothetical protein